MVVQVKIIHKSQLFPSSCFLHCRLFIWMALWQDKITENQFTSLVWLDPLILLNPYFYAIVFLFFFFSCINRKTDHAALEYLGFSPGVFLLSAEPQTTVYIISQHRVFFSVLLYSRQTTVECMINNQYAYHFNIRGKKIYRIFGTKQPNKWLIQLSMTHK